MSVEDLRLLACPLFWSVIGERTGANEKPVQATTSERASLLFEHTARNLCLAVVARERGETKRENAGAQEKLSTFFVPIIAENIRNLPLLTARRNP